MNYKAMMMLKSLLPAERVDMDASLSWGLGAVNLAKKEFFLLKSSYSLR